MKNFIKDGVYHIEARAFLGVMYDENNKKLTLEEEVGVILEIVNEIKK